LRRFEISKYEIDWTAEGVWECNWFLEAWGCIDGGVMLQTWIRKGTVRKIDWRNERKSDRIDFKREGNGRINWRISIISYSGRIEPVLGLIINQRVEKGVLRIVAESRGEGKGDWWIKDSHIKDIRAKHFVVAIDKTFNW